MAVGRGLFDNHLIGRAQQPPEFHAVTANIREHSNLAEVAVGVGYDQHFVGPRESDQREPRLPCPVDCQARRRGHGYEQWNAGQRGFLDQLIGTARSEQCETAAPVDAGTHAMTDQFVEGIVPADVLAQRDKRAVGIEQRSGVHGASAGVERLMPPNGVQGLKQNSTIDLPGWRHTRQWPERLVEILDSAEPATRLARAVSHALQHGVLPLRIDLDVEQQSPLLTGNRDVGDLAGAVDNPLRNGKADREILEVGGRRHHHGITDAEEAHGHRRFDGDHPFAGANARR